jgi:hypothetical protein
MSGVRLARVAADGDLALWVIERHGCRAFCPRAHDAAQSMAARECLESFRQRRRAFDCETDGFRHLSALIDNALDKLDLDPERVADLFFFAEREYWQRRNRAAQLQKARQDRLGLGWGNHDHHTYRSSREHFSKLIAIFAKLGFTSRERFYAGADAGWGAQVLEQPAAGIVIFADVDLSPEELSQDFSHDGLAARKELGTVGLWCALHGEAIFEAGMHHLECQFDFEALKQQLESQAGVRVMNPFTNFPYLKQAFTEGERWPVSEARIAKLLAAGQITPAQAQQFRASGAIGSHLENLERNQGFKGFNQKGVSDIIERTDPRKQRN